MSVLLHMCREGGGDAAADAAPARNRGAALGCRRMAEARSHRREDRFRDDRGRRWLSGRDVWRPGNRTAERSTGRPAGAVIREVGAQTRRGMVEGSEGSMVTHSAGYSLRLSVTFQNDAFLPKSRCQLRWAVEARPYVSVSSASSKPKFSPQTSRHTSHGQILPWPPPHAAHTWQERRCSRVVSAYGPEPVQAFRTSILPGYLPGRRPRSDTRTVTPTQSMETTND